jgi:hypothetical protein
MESRSRPRSVLRGADPRALRVSPMKPRASVIGDAPPRVSALETVRRLLQQASAGFPMTPEKVVAALDAAAREDATAASTYTGIDDARAAWIAITAIDRGFGANADSAMEPDLWAELAEILHACSHATKRMEGLLGVITRGAEKLQGPEVRVPGQLALEVGKQRVKAVCPCPGCREARAPGGPS